MKNYPKGNAIYIYYFPKRDFYDNILDNTFRRQIETALDNLKNSIIAHTYCLVYLTQKYHKRVSYLDVQ